MSNVFENFYPKDESVQAYFNDPTIKAGTPLESVYTKIRDLMTGNRDSAVKFTAPDSVVSKIQKNVEKVKASLFKITFEKDTDGKIIVNKIGKANIAAFLKSAGFSTQHISDIKDYLDGFKYTLDIKFDSKDEKSNFIRMVTDPAFLLFKNSQIVFGDMSARLTAVRTPSDPDFIQKNSAYFGKDDEGDVSNNEKYSVSDFVQLLFGTYDDIDIIGKANRPLSFIKRLGESRIVPCGEVKGMQIFAVGVNDDEAQRFEDTCKLWHFTFEDYSDVEKEADPAVHSRRALSDTGYNLLYGSTAGAYGAEHRTSPLVELGKTFDKLYFIYLPASAADTSISDWCEKNNIDTHFIKTMQLNGNGAIRGFSKAKNIPTSINGEPIDLDKPYWEGSEKDESLKEALVEEKQYTSNASGLERFKETLNNYKIKIIGITKDGKIQTDSEGTPITKEVTIPEKFEYGSETIAEALFNICSGSRTTLNVFDTIYNEEIVQALYTLCTETAMGQLNPMFVPELANIAIDIPVDRAGTGRDFVIHARYLYDDGMYDSITAAFRSKYIDQRELIEITPVTAKMSEREQNQIKWENEQVLYGKETVNGKNILAMYLLEEIYSKTALNSGYSGFFTAIKPYSRNRWYEVTASTFDSLTDAGSIARRQELESLGGDGIFIVGCEDEDELQKGIGTANLYGFKTLDLTAKHLKDHNILYNYIGTSEIEQVTGVTPRKKKPLSALPIDYYLAYSLANSYEQALNKLSISNPVKSADILGRFPYYFGVITSSRMYNMTVEEWFKNPNPGHADGGFISAVKKGSLTLSMLCHVSQDGTTGAIIDINNSGKALNELQITSGYEAMKTCISSLSTKTYNDSLSTASINYTERDSAKEVKLGDENESTKKRTDTVAIDLKDRLWKERSTANDIVNDYWDYAISGWKGEDTTAVIRCTINNTGALKAGQDWSSGSIQINNRLNITNLKSDINNTKNTEPENSTAAISNINDSSVEDINDVPAEAPAPEMVTTESIKRASHTKQILESILESFEQTKLLKNKYEDICKEAPDLDTWARVNYTEYLNEINKNENTLNEIRTKYRELAYYKSKPLYRLITNKEYWATSNASEYKHFVDDLLAVDDQLAKATTANGSEKDFNDKPKPLFNFDSVSGKDIDTIYDTTRWYLEKENEANNNYIKDIEKFLEDSIRKVDKQDRRGTTNPDHYRLSGLKSAISYGLFMNKNNVKGKVDNSTIEKLLNKDLSGPFTYTDINGKTETNYFTPEEQEQIKSINMAYLAEKTMRDDKYIKDITEKLPAVFSTSDNKSKAITEFIKFLSTKRPINAKYDNDLTDNRPKSEYALDVNEVNETPAESPKYIANINNDIHDTDEFNDNERHKWKKNVGTFEKILNLVEIGNKIKNKFEVFYSPAAEATGRSIGDVKVELKKLDSTIERIDRLIATNNDNNDHILNKYYNDNVKAILNPAGEGNRGMVDAAKYDKPIELSNFGFSDLYRLLHDNEDTLAINQTDSKDYSDNWVCSKFKEYVDSGREQIISAATSKVNNDYFDMSSDIVKLKNGKKVKFNKYGSVYAGFADVNKVLPPTISTVFTKAVLDLETPKNKLTDKKFEIITDNNLDDTGRLEYHMEKDDEGSTTNAVAGGHVFVINVKPSDPTKKVEQQIVISNDGEILHNFDDSGNRIAHKLNVATELSSSSNKYTKASFVKWFKTQFIPTLLKDYVYLTLCYSEAEFAKLSAEQADNLKPNNFEMLLSDCPNLKNKLSN